MCSNRSVWTGCLPGARASIVTQALTREQRLGEAEITQIADAHGIENAAQMIDFVLHDARMEVADGSIDGLPELIHAPIAQVLVTRHQAAHPGDGQTALPALLGVLCNGLQL